MPKTDEKTLQSLREQRALNPEKHRAEVKSWKGRNREKVLAQRRRAYYKNHDGILEKRRKHRIKLRAMVDVVFGTKCFLCGEEHPKRFNLHEIHGKRHPLGRQYILNHKEDFVRLCAKCHRMVTRMMRVFKVSWKDILRLKARN